MCLLMPMFFQFLLFFFIPDMRDDVPGFPMKLFLLWAGLLSISEDSIRNIAADRQEIEAKQVLEGPVLTKLPHQTHNVML